MKIYFEIQDGDDLYRWAQDSSWSGARDRISDINEYNDGWDYLFAYIDANEEMSEGDLNDFIWFSALDVLIEEFGSSEEVKDKLREISSYLGREVDVNELDDLYETEDDKYREGEDYDSYLQDLIDEYRELESKLGDAKPKKKVKDRKSKKAQDGRGNPWWWIKPPVGVTYSVDYSPYDESKDDEEQEIDRDFEWDNLKEIIEWFLTTANEKFKDNDFSLEDKQADRESLVYEGKLYNLYLTETDYGDAVLSLQRVDDGELRDRANSYSGDEEGDEKEYQELLARQNELFEPLVALFKKTLLDVYPNDVRVPTSAWTSGELQ